LQTHTPRPRRNGKTPSRRRRRQTRTYAPAGAQRPSAGRRPPGPAATRWRRRTVRSAAGRRHCWWGHPVAAARVARRRDEGHPTWMHLCFRGHWSCLRGRVGSVSRRWGSTRRGWQLKAPPPTGSARAPLVRRLELGGACPVDPCWQAACGHGLRSPGRETLTGELRLLRAGPGSCLGAMWWLRWWISWRCCADGRSAHRWPRAPNLPCARRNCVGPRGAGRTDGPGQPGPARGRVAKVAAPGAAADKMTGAAAILPL